MVHAVVLHCSRCSGRPRLRELDYGHVQLNSMLHSGTTNLHIQIKEYPRNTYSSPTASAIRTKHRTLRAIVTATTAQLPAHLCITAPINPPTIMARI